jgi:cellulose biosynthesis protein BcsQ
MVFTVANLRGGAGKTTTTLYLSKILSEKEKVLIIDLDPQASVGILYNMSIDKLAKYNVMKALASRKLLNKCIYRISDNLHLLPSYMDLQDFDRQFARVISPELMVKDLIGGLDKYEYVFIDTPPQFSSLTKNAIMAANNIIIPIDPHILSLEGASRLINNIDEIVETSPSRKEVNIHKFFVLPTQHKKLFASFQKEFLKTVQKTFMYNDIVILPPVSVYEKLRSKQTRFEFLNGEIVNEYKKAAKVIINTIEEKNNE